MMVAAIMRGGLGMAMLCFFLLCLLGSKSLKF
jgi:hypothetical protein